MRGLWKIAAIAVALLVLATTQRPAPETESPAIEINRTAAASYFDPVNRPILNVLIIGSDVREGDPRRGRADSLHVLTVNTKTGAGTLIGIPRDSYIEIPGRGTNKVNAALFFGGPGSVVDAVSRFSGLKIHYWALIEFSRFRKLVDTLGGVEVKVPYPMSDTASGAFFKKGVKKMNGEQALAFSRARKTVPGGDFGRSENQGRVLLGALEKFRKEASSPMKLATYVRAFHAQVEANVKHAELIRLANVGRSLKPWKVRNIVLPGSAGNAGGASVVFIGGPAKDIFRKVQDDAVL